MIRRVLNPNPRAREVREVSLELERSKRLWKFRKARQRFERAYVDYVLRLCGGDKKKAAKRLGISYSSVKEKCQPGFGGRR